MSHCPSNKFQIGCCLCSKFCFSIDSLENHLAVDHFNSDPFQCERCCSNGRPSKFPTESAVKRHYIEEHRMEKFYFRTWVTREIEANRIAIRKCLEKCIQAALGQKTHAKPSNSPFPHTPSAANSHCPNRPHNGQCPKAFAVSLAGHVICTAASNQPKDTVKPTKKADVITIGEEECAAAKKKYSQVESDSPSQSDVSEPSNQIDEGNPADLVKAKPSSDEVKSTSMETGAKVESPCDHKETTDATSRTSPFIRCSAAKDVNNAAPVAMFGHLMDISGIHRVAMQHHHHSKLNRTATLGHHSFFTIAAASQERKRKHHQSFNEF